MPEENNNGVNEGFFRDGEENISAIMYNARNREKKHIKKAANCIGFAFCATLLLNIVLGFIAGVVLATVGKPEFADDPFFLNYFQILGSFVMFVPAYIIASRRMKINLSRALPFSPPKDKGDVLPALMIGYGFCIIANISGNIITNILSRFGLESSVDFPNLEGLHGFLLMTVSTAIIPALVEEFAYRGVVLSLLKPYGEGFAVFCSALLFALIHGNMSQIPFAFIVGLVLGTICVRTGSIWVSIVLHFINNFIAVCITYLTNGMGDAEMGITSFVWISVSMLVMTGGLLILQRRQKNLVEFAPSSTVNDRKTVYKTFFSSGGIITALILGGIFLIASFAV